MSPAHLRTPLIVLDVQDAIDQPVWDGKNNPTYVGVIQRLLAHWRGRGWPVLHVKHDEPAPNSTYHTHGPYNAIKPEVAPEPSEPVIVKSNNCAFIETKLHDTLQSLDVTRFVLTGVVIHNSMDATIRAGKALGYEIIVPEDATTAVPVKNRKGQRWDAATVQSITLAILDGEYAEVTSSEALLNADSKN